MNKKFTIKIFASVFAYADIIAMNIPIDESQEATQLRNMHFCEESIRGFKEINITMQDIEAMQKAKLMTSHISELELAGFSRSDILNMIHRNKLSILNCKQLLDIIDVYYAPFDILQRLLKRETLINDRLKYETYRVCLNDVKMRDSEIDEIIDKSFIFSNVLELAEIGITSTQLLRLIRKHNLQRNNYRKLIDGASIYSLEKLLDYIYSEHIDFNQIEFSKIVVTDMTSFLRKKQNEEREKQQGMLTNTISDTYRMKTVKKYIKNVTTNESIEQTLLKKIFSYNDISASSCIIILDAYNKFSWLDSLYTNANTILNKKLLKTNSDIVLLSKRSLKQQLAEHDCTNKEFSSKYGLTKYKPFYQRALHRGFNFMLNVLDILLSDMPTQDESTRYILHFASWFATLKSDTHISYVNFKKGETTLQRLNVFN